MERPDRYIQAYLDEPETPDEVVIAREMSRDALAEEPWQGSVKVHLLPVFPHPKTLTPTLSHPHSRPPGRGRRHPKD